MNRKLVWVITLIIIAVVISAYFLINRTNSETTVFVEPETVQQSVGQDFTVNITISHVAHLYAWECEIGWNPLVLDLVDVTEGTFLKNGGLTFFTYVTNATTGNSLIDCTLMGSAPGVDGQGVLASVQFRVKIGGTCDLDLRETQLIGSNDQVISHVANGGRFSSVP
jgi:general secretion pathway protein D